MKRKDSAAPGQGSIATAPAQKSGLSLPPLDPVVALRVVGSDLPEIPLSATRRTFVLGSDFADPDVTVKVTSRMNGDPNAAENVSRVHLTIQRKGNQLWILDQQSTNGTYINDREAKDGDVQAGDTLRVGNVTLIALDEQMLLLRPRLQWVLGFHANAEVDAALKTVISGDPLLLIGEAGCEQRWLAEQIHCTSARRQNGFAAIPAPLTHSSEQTAHLALASHGTAFLDLAEFDKVPAPFVNELFGATYHIRPIVASPDLARASTQLGQARAHSLRIISIPPIRKRREDVPRILNSLFRRPPLEKKRDVAELPPEKVERLVAFDWPDNFDDLRRNAPKILALVESGGNKRAAARQLGVTHQSLGQVLARIGL